MVKSGTSPPRKVWKSWSAVDDTYLSSKTLRNLFKERVSIFRNFRTDLTVLSGIYMIVAFGSHENGYIQTKFELYVLTYFMHISYLIVLIFQLCNP